MKIPYVKAINKETEKEIKGFYNDQARKPLIFRLGDEWLIHKPT